MVRQGAPHAWVLKLLKFPKAATSTLQPQPFSKTRFPVDPHIEPDEIFFGLLFPELPFHLIQPTFQPHPFHIPSKLRVVFGIFHCCCELLFIHFTNGSSDCFVNFVVNCTGQQTFIIRTQPRSQVPRNRSRTWDRGCVCWRWARCSCFGCCLWNLGWVLWRGGGRLLDHHLGNCFLHFFSNWSMSSSPGVEEASATEVVEPD